MSNDTRYIPSSLSRKVWEWQYEWAKKEIKALLDNGFAGLEGLLTCESISILEWIRAQEDSSAAAMRLLAGAFSGVSTPEDERWAIETHRNLRLGYQKKCREEREMAASTPLLKKSSYVKEMQRVILGCWNGKVVENKIDEDGDAWIKVMVKGSEHWTLRTCVDKPHFGASDPIRVYLDHKSLKWPGGAACLVGYGDDLGGVLGGVPFLKNQLLADRFVAAQKVAFARTWEKAEKLVLENCLENI